MATEVLVKEPGHTEKGPGRRSASPTSVDPAVLESTAWQELCRRFLRHHRSPLNVLFHLLTTPLALLGVYILIGWLDPWLMVGIAAAQVVLVACLTPVAISVLHALVCGAVGLAAYQVQAGPFVGVCCFVVGYCLQDAAHWLVKESTYQSSYRNEARWGQAFLEHTLLLLPVLLTLALRSRQSPLRMLVARKPVLKTKLNAQSQRQDFEQVLDWVRANQTTSEQSTHWWQSDLDDQAAGALRRLSRDPQLINKIRRFHGAGYGVEPVSGMNEVYLTGPSKQATSDTVFYRGHVDGPWAVFPGARLYRCMLALNQNLEVTTHFPMASLRYSVPDGHRLEHGDAVAFDFNRELHYITRNPDPRQSESRINLKLHFVAYPVRLAWYGKLLAAMTTWYDQRARELFLETIQPTGWWAALKTQWVLGWTKLFELAVRFVGWTNLAFLVAVGLVSMLMSDWRIWLAATSFVHYAIYLGTLQERTPVSFGTFKRDAVFFKTVSLLQLFAVYAMGFQKDWGSLLGVIGGFTLAGYAAVVLGPTRTLFSSELGLEPPERISRFPYGVIPHPMILGALIGIACMLGASPVREQFGWLIAGHLIAYGLVLGQEIRLSGRRLTAMVPATEDS